jgi:hypothetical protein
LLPVSSRQIEMVWRCSSCGHKNLGRHKLCQRCGNPKDASEQYEMPGDTAAAETVTAPELLRIATSGPNWQCSFCGSHQRRFDGVCAQCGAGQSQGQDVAGVMTLPGQAGAAAPTGSPWDPSEEETLALVGKPRGRGLKLGAALAAMLTTVLGCCGLGGLLGGGDPSGVKTHFVTRVTARSWERVVTVERYRYVAQEAFSEDIPADAAEQTSLGQRHHHNEQVLDGYDTEHYTVRVQDGYDTERYTERVACGQDCTDRPQHCREVCSPNGNGFATCRTECSGGGQSCSTRYCNESRTRQVQRYRDDPRTRQVPRYRTESRTAEWFRYRVWRWGQDRVLRAEGHGAEPPRWPGDEEVQLNVTLGEGERERERRSETFEVTLQGALRQFVTRPADEATFAGLAWGSQHFVRTSEGGGFAVEGRADGPPP